MEKTYEEILIFLAPNSKEAQKLQIAQNTGGIRDFSRPKKPILCVRPCEQCHIITILGSMWWKATNQSDTPKRQRENLGFEFFQVWAEASWSFES